MNQIHPAIAWLSQERENYRGMLADLKAGKTKLGRVEGGELKDTTQDQIKLIEQKLLEMDALLS